MKKIYIIAVLVICIVSAVVAFKSVDTLPATEALQVQLRGGGCMFGIYDDVPVKRSFFDGISRRNDAEMCVIDAAKLLALMHNENTDMVPVLIEGLRNNFNVDSGDGIVPVRSEIALALGRLGDKRALNPLQGILASEDQVTLSETGRFPLDYEIRKGTSHKAVETAIEEIYSK